MHSLRRSAMFGGMPSERPCRKYPGVDLFRELLRGVTEAVNEAGEMFGNDRVVEALNTDCDAAPEQVLGNMRKAIDDFVKDAEQFDDMTMLCVEYKGK